MPFTLKRDADGATKTYDQPVPVPPGFSVVEQKDVMGRAKEFLTQEPPPGERHGLNIGPDLGPYVRSAGRFLLPGSLESLASQAMMGGVPGSGVLPTLGRVGGAGAAAAGISALKGESPGRSALEHGAEAAVGEGVGGVVRAGARMAQGAMEGTLQKIGKAIGEAVPEFKGANPLDTLKRIFSGEASEALQQKYRDTLTGLVKQHGDPVVILPSLAKLAPQQPMGAWEASKAMTLIDSLRRNLRTASGDLSRQQLALQKRDLLEAAESELKASLKQKWPAEAQKVMEKADQDYFAGKSVIRMVGAGRERITEARHAKLMTPGPAQAPWQRAFMGREGELKRALPEKGFQNLKGAIRRGETDPRKVDIPGQSPGFGLGLGFIPHVYGLPRAPKLAGRPEKIAEKAAAAGRVIGERGAERAAGDE